MKFTALLLCCVAMVFAPMAFCADALPTMPEEELLQKFGDHTIACPIRSEKNEWYALTLQKGETGMSMFVTQEMYGRVVVGMAHSAPTLGELLPEEAKAAEKALESAHGPLERVRAFMHVETMKLKVLGTHPSGKEWCAVLAFIHPNGVGFIENPLTQEEAETLGKALESKRVTLTAALKAQKALVEKKE